VTRPTLIAVGDTEMGLKSPRERLGNVFNQTLPPSAHSHSPNPVYNTWKPKITSESV